MATVTAIAMAGGAATALAVHERRVEQAAAHQAAVGHARMSLAAARDVIETVHASATEALEARDHALAAAQARIDAVPGELDAAPHAGDDPRSAVLEAVETTNAAIVRDASRWTAHEANRAAGDLEAAIVAVRDAQAAWQAAEDARKAAEAARVAACGIKCVARETLDNLPYGSNVSIEWHNPALGSHLGGVYKGETHRMLLNPNRLAGNPSKTKDVVRHEIAHIYQGLVMKRHGLTWGGLSGKMSAAFGSNAMEKSADCVALRFGASWTWYTKSCGTSAQQAWVTALIEGRLP